MRIKRALISVYDKTDIVEFARELQKLGIEIISTGGTAETLKREKIPVTPIEKVTDFPELLEGRLKTLHPKIHGGILADRGSLKQMEQMRKHEIEPIDLVIVNLYPFREVISKEKVDLDNAIENIDIGGPAMIRAAAKNYKWVTVITSPSQYKEVIYELKEKGGIKDETRKKLAAKAFEITSYYDSLVSDYLRSKFVSEISFPEFLTLGFEKVSECRYGENPHQKGAVYKSLKTKEPCIVNVEILQGKEMSFNNYLDANAAVELLKEFSEPSAVIIKHTNPCGAASSKTISDAFKKAYDCDQKSAFGGIIALNRACNLETATQIASFFNEVVIAPSYDKDALAALSAKKNLRVLKLEKLGTDFSESGLDFKRISGGLLVQQPDKKCIGETDLQFVSEKKPSPDEMRDLLFAWSVVKHVKSNAVVVAKDSAAVGIGSGQTSRIDSTEIAIKKAGANSNGAALASDGFFPFRDSIDYAAETGITAIIQPGGSVKDEEVIKAANEHKLSLIFTGCRHFKH